MSEWTRHGDNGVEYRTVDGKVFVRHSANEDMLAFTAAEWDTFVAGLVRDERHARRLNEASLGGELAQLREDLTTETARAESLAGDLDKLGQDYVRVMTERDNLAAENARLRQQLTAAELHRDDYAGRLKTRNDQLAEADRERIAANAEAAVLRHRDRRTQQLIRSVEWFGAGYLWRNNGQEHVLDPAEVSVFIAADQQTERERTQAVVEAAKRAVAALVNADNWLPPSVGPRWVALVDAVSHLQKAPETAPSATEPAEQPQPVAQPTDGPEPQGEAQRACGYCAAPLVETPDGWTDLDGGRGGPRPAVHWHFPKPSPRVWNAGDPEPEGVRSVLDEDGSKWTRLGEQWGYYDADADETDWRTWSELVDNLSPLTEVLPEPTRVLGGFYPDAPILVPDNTRIVDLDGNTVGVYRKPAEPLTPVAFCTCGHCRVAREVYANANPAKPNGEVPEAGLASSAQTMTDEQVVEFMKTEDELDATYAKMRAHDRGECDHCSGQLPMWECDLLQRPPKPLTSTPVNPEFEPRGPVVDQDRTEVGLDAAIEAALAAGFPGLPDGMTLDEARRRIAAAVRAASPLFERAALNAAAARLRAEAEAEAMRLNVTDPQTASTPINNWLAGIRESANLVEQLATRTETP